MRYEADIADSLFGVTLVSLLYQTDGAVRQAEPDGAGNARPAGARNAPPVPPPPRADERRAPSEPPLRVRSPVDHPLAKYPRNSESLPPPALSGSGEPGPRTNPGDSFGLIPGQILNSGDRVRNQRQQNPAPIPGATQCSASMRNRPKHRCARRAMRTVDQERAHARSPGEAPKQTQSAASDGTTNGTAVGRAVRQRTCHTTRTAKTDQVRSGQKLSLPNIQNVEQQSENNNLVVQHRKHPSDGQTCRVAIYDEQRKCADCRVDRSAM